MGRRFRAIGYVEPSRFAGLAQAGTGSVPNAAAFAAILRAKGWAAGIPLMRAAIEKWNIDPAAPGYEDRKTKAILAARVAIQFATQARDMLIAMASAWDDWWKAGALTLPFQISGHRQLLASAGSLSEFLTGDPSSGTAGITVYIEQRPGIVRIQRAIQIMLDKTEAGFRLMDDLKNSFTGKALRVANRITGLIEKTFDVATALYEAILALLAALAAIAKGIAEWWPVVLVIGGGLLLWWLLSKPQGAKARA